MKKILNLFLDSCAFFAIAAAVLALSVLVGFALAKVPVFCLVFGVGCIVILGIMRALKAI